MPQTLPKRLVLVADDNHDLARCTAFLLQLKGFRVATAFDGPGAIAALADGIPNIALLDIGLPGLDSFRVAERIRASQGAKSVLIIAISGYSPDMVRTNPLRHFFDHHLIKPVDFGTLLPLLNGAG